jgi:polysaccharide pyruvyl transferase WcaK-like protein
MINKLLTMNRRHFIHVTVAAALGASLRAAAPGRPPRILLRSSWQVVNIGDIAHTPGVLALIQKHIPEAETMLWASADLSPEVAAMEHKRFPKLRIVMGSIDSEGKASNAELAEAVGWADFLLHGSGPSLVAARDVAAFARHTDKPYGVYGITHGSFFTGARDNEILSGGQFVFFRDSVSLASAKDSGVTCPIMEFGPDGAFACDLRDDAAAEAFLEANDLVHGQFLCCIPRLRWTPYWEIRGTAMDARAQERHARNEAMAEHDHAPLREAITAVIRETPLKVLVCPEDMSQMAVGKRWIVDKLPDEVRSRVVWREKFWLTDEALSIYLRSAGMFGLEMHSPIMCVGNGVPAIVCRFAEQTSKGIMWRDIGLGDWLFDFDREDEVKKLVPAVLAMVKHPDAAKAKVAAARGFIEQRQRETMAAVRRSLPVGALVP